MVVRPDAKIATGGDSGGRKVELENCLLDIEIFGVFDAGSRGGRGGGNTPTIKNLGKMGNLGGF